MSTSDVTHSCVIEVLSELVIFSTLIFTLSQMHFLLNLLPTVSKPTK